MKVLVNIMVFLFFAFLSAPTIVSLVQEEEDDISLVCDLNEEEMQKEIKEVQLGLHFEFEISFYKAAKKSTLIKSENLQKHDNVFGDIFLPPPEII
ncbi:hypothetical protein [Flavobacterium rhizosphaerae]|uniref:Uncharacterized protein n=1 Tax=Flavobacterium rhizosphaerae TaxID=3163298 RepID=A0ABW8YX59_9FLAO